MSLEAANAVLASFSIAQIERRRDGFHVYWPNVRTGGRTSRRWQTRGQDFYPVWSRRYPGGGTSCTALSQLIRWLRGQPVLPLSCWLHWASPGIALLSAAAVDQLKQAGYPEKAACVLCGIQLAGRYDWWHLDGVSGPCCVWTEGCRQKASAAP